MDLRPSSPRVLTPVPPPPRFGGLGFCSALALASMLFGGGLLQGQGPAEAAPGPIAQDGAGEVSAAEVEAAEVEAAEDKASEVGAGEVDAAEVGAEGDEVDEVAEGEEVPDAELERLLAALGADTFEQREAAMAALMLRGAAVVPHLQRVRTTSNDPEIRFRARQLAEQLSRDDFEARVALFLQGGSGEALPGWDYTRQSLGDTPAVRELFVEMCRTTPELLESLSGPPRERLLAASEAAESISLAVRSGLRDARRGDLVVLLLASQAADSTLDLRSDDTIRWLMNRSVATQMARDPQFEDSFRVLAGDWIRRAREEMRSEAMWFAMQWDIEAGREAALRTLADSKEVAQLQTALQTLARFGRRDDIETLMPWLDDRRSVSTSNSGYQVLGPEGREMRTQLGDVALATIALIHRLPLDDAGFFAPREHPNVAFDIDSLGFPLDDEEDQLRRQARRRVLEHVAAQAAEPEEGTDKE